MAHNSRERLKKKRGPSLVLVNDTQARRHVSENVQHVGDLWGRSTAEPALSLVGLLTGPGRVNSLLHLEGSAVIV